MLAWVNSFAVLQGRVAAFLPLNESPSIARFLMLLLIDDDVAALTDCAALRIRRRLSTRVFRGIFRRST